MALRERSERLNELLDQLNMLYESAYGKVDEYFSEALKRKRDNA